MYKKTIVQYIVYYYSYRIVMNTLGKSQIIFDGPHKSSRLKLDDSHEISSGFIIYDICCDLHRDPHNYKDGCTKIKRYSIKHNNEYKIEAFGIPTIRDMKKVSAISEVMLLIY